MIGMVKLIFYIYQTKNIKLNLEPILLIIYLLLAMITGKSGEVIFSPDEIFKQYSNESGSFYLVMILK